MNVVLDSGGITALAGDGHVARARRRAMLDSGLWPPTVPAPTLVEALTGDHRSDHGANRLLRDCEVVPTDELTARAAAQLRTAAGDTAGVSAVDAIVVAVANSHTGPVGIITSDLPDITRLIVATNRPDITAHRA